MKTTKEFVEDLSKDLYGMTSTKAWTKGMCVDCKEPALVKCYSDAGRREYQITGLCEMCFDKICEE